MDKETIFKELSNLKYVLQNKSKKCGDFLEAEMYADWVKTIQNTLDLLNDYRHKERCPCIHCTNNECEEVCKEYEDWYKEK